MVENGISLFGGYGMALSRLQVRPKLNSMEYEVLSPPGTGESSVSHKRYHFIGAGGIGMSGLARLMVKNEAVVTGSDMEATKVTAQLCENRL